MSAAVPPHVAARHHALGPEHIDALHRWWGAGDLALESGARVERCGVGWVEHGIDDPDGARTILGCTAIGATHHRHDFLVGPGRALDTTRFRIVVIDALGNGLSTSPSNSATQGGPGFPRFTIGDMVAAQHRLLVELLGLRRVHAVVGASMGGMQALEWGVRHPGFCARIVAMTPMARTAPWARAINEAARRALMGDPAFDGGRYAAQPARGWRDWAVIMRVLGARTPEALAAMEDFDGWFRATVDGTLAANIDANDWIAQSHAYDAHDVARGPRFGGDLAAALGSMRARLLVAAPPLDLYNPAACAREAASLVPGARFAEIPSAFGHNAATSADPAAAAFLDAEIARFLA